MRGSNRRNETRQNQTTERMTAQENQLIYKIRNELVEELKKDWPLTYQNEFRAQIKVIDRIIKELTNGKD